MHHTVLTSLERLVDLVLGVLVLQHRLQTTHYRLQTTVLVLHYQVQVLCVVCTLLILTYDTTPLKGFSEILKQDLST